MTKLLWTLLLLTWLICWRSPIREVHMCVATVALVILSVLQTLVSAYTTALFAEAVALCKQIGSGKRMMRTSAVTRQAPTISEFTTGTSGSASSFSARVRSHMTSFSSLLNASATVATPLSTKMSSEAYSDL